jgi:hypothetical protein
MSATYDPARSRPIDRMRAKLNDVNVPDHPFRQDEEYVSVLPDALTPGDATAEESVALRQIANELISEYSLMPSELRIGSVTYKFKDLLAGWLLLIEEAEEAITATTAAFQTTRPTRGTRSTYGTS